MMGGISWAIRGRLLRRGASLIGTAYQEPLARSAEATTVLAILAALAGGLLSILRSRGVLRWVPAHILTAFVLMAIYLLLAGMGRGQGVGRLARLMVLRGAGGGAPACGATPH